MRKKPRHSKQNVLVQLSAGTRRVMTREMYTRMCDQYLLWYVNTSIVCIIPYPSPDLFNKEHT